MNENTTTPDVEETTGALVLVESINPVELFGNGVGMDLLLAEVKRQTQDIVPDTSTESGRKQIKSLAYRVSRTKTVLDEIGKKFTEDRRAELKAIDANRSKLTRALDEIRDATRKPVDDWEAAEELRQQEELRKAREEAEARAAAEQFDRDVQARIDSWKGMPAAFMGLDLAAAETQLAVARSGELIPEQFGDRLPEAQAARAEALDKIANYLGMQRKLVDAEAAEQRRLAEQAERERLEREAEALREREARERRERIAMAIQGLQTKPLMDAVGKSVDGIEAIIARTTAVRADLSPEVYGDQIEAARQSCDVALRKLSEALTEREEADRAAAQAAEEARQQAAVAAEQARVAEEARRAQEAELTRLREQAEQQRQAEAQRQEAERQQQREQAARDRQAANERHRAKVRSEVVHGLVEAGVDPDVADLVVATIDAGKVPHVTIRF